MAGQSAFTLYTTANVGLGSNPNIKNRTSINIDADSGNIPTTTLEGLLGVTPGAGVIMVQLGMAVPLDATEINFYPGCREREPTTLRVYRGGEVLAVSAFIMKIRESKDTNSPYAQTIELLCNLGEFTKI